MRKIFIKIAIFLRYLMRGLHSADAEAFEGKTQESEDGTTAEQQQETNNVYQNLLTDSKGYGILYPMNVLHS